MSLYEKSPVVCDEKRMRKKGERTDLWYRIFDENPAIFEYCWGKSTRIHRAISTQKPYK